ncbi:ankyrin repeat domain-containing protein 26-like isoform X4 [Mastomys coucha]|uniref:ankyrin repeat domain-containing protein 26-like isoform X4 n=1 Tax=Mastomys coucha TaxID=35658 RepID=UPI0012620B3A|nr:ankyrin repeat domain-containing protein 26-like isoform X4 [Mastomys coucha]
MSKLAGLSSKKSRWLLQSLLDQQRHSLGTGFESANILLSPKYHLKDKDLRKIHKAASVGDAARVQQLLLGKCCVNDKDKKKRTALHIACAYGYPKVVMALIEGRCEINATDSEECTSLVKAVQCQEEECATILLENGADPNIVDAQGNSALHYAVYYKNTSLAAKLLDCEVNIEVTNKGGFTPFLLAVSENKLKIAKFLLMKNANIHAVDNQKRTALMHAVSHDSTNLVRFVLQQGVDLFLKDAFGLTAIDYAADFKYNSNMKILLEYKEKRYEESARVNLVEKSSEDDSTGRKDQQSRELENMEKEELTEPGTRTEEQAEPYGRVTSVEEPRRLNGRGDDQPQEGATASKTREEQDVTCTLATGKEDVDDSSWDSESVSENLPLIRIGVDGLLQVNGQAVENPEKYLHWLPNRKREESVPNQTKGVRDLQAFPPAEPCLELTSEEKHQELSRNEDDQHPAGDTTDFHLSSKGAAEKGQMQSQEGCKQRTGREGHMLPGDAVLCQLHEDLVVSQVIEEGQKQEWSEWAASENLGEAPLDHSDLRSPLTRMNGKPGAQQSPSVDSKEQDGSGLNIKEEKKRKHKEWSRDFVNELTSEESESVASDILPVKDSWSLNDTDPNKGRSAKKKSKQKHKVRGEMNAMEDADDQTQPFESSSQNDRCSNIQQTKMENEPCELLSRQTGTMQGSVAEGGVLKTEPVRSRVALKEKKEKGEGERVTIQLPGRDELYPEDTERQQHDMALRMLHLKVKQTLKQLQEAQDRQREVVQSWQRMQDHLQKLQARCSEAEVMVQEQGEKTAELQKLHAGLARVKKERLKKLNKITLSLKCSLDQTKDKNEDLERELTEIKKHLGVMRKKLNDHENGEFSCQGDLKTKEHDMNVSVDMLKNEIHELKEKWGTITSKYLPLNIQFKYIEQELLSIKVAQKQYEKLQEAQKSLQRDALDLQCQLRENMAKLEDKKHASALRDSNNDSVMSQMELRIKDLESELEKLEAEKESNARKVEKYQQRCVRERELSKMLSHKLINTNNKLSKVRTDILLVTEWNRTVQNTLTTRPVSKGPGVTQHGTYVNRNPNFIASRNPEPAISSPQPSPELMQRSLLKKQQKMAKDIIKEVDKADVESWSLEAYPSGSK